MGLGRVDVLENDQAECECDERPEVPVRLLAAERDALETLELSHELLDAGARPVERLREEGRPLLGRGLHGDDRADAPLAGRSPVGLGIIAFVAHRGAGRDIRPEVEQDLELAAVARLTRGQVEGERQAVEIDLDVDLGREAPARAAEGLARGPPFSPSRRAPAAESLFRNSWPACKVRVRSMTEVAERWSACSIATAAWPRTWRQPADRGVSWRCQGRWRRARPHRQNSETGSKVD